MANPTFDISLNALIEDSNIKAELAKIAEDQQIDLQINAIGADDIQDLYKDEEIEIIARADVGAAKADIRAISDDQDVEINVKANTSEAEAGISDLNDAFNDGVGSAGGFLGSISEIGQSLISGGIFAAGITAGVLAITSLVGAFGDAVDAGFEFNSALLDTQARLNLTDSELASFDQNLDDVFRAGVGDTLAEAAEIFANAKKNFGDVFPDEELAEFTGRAQALGNLYDLDVNEVLIKSGTFVKQFGLDSEQAFNLLGKSLQEAGTAQDDVIDTLSEYSQLAVTAGFSAETFTQTLVNGAQEGIFNTDKLGDAIKETQLRINAGDFSTAFAGILDEGDLDQAQSDLVLFLDQIAQAGKDGTLTVRDVLSETTSAIDTALQSGEITNSFAQTLQVAIAGTPAEDIGTDIFNRVFSAEIDPQVVANQAAEIGASLDNAVGQYTSFEEFSREIELFTARAGAGLIGFGEEDLDFATTIFADFLGPIIGDLQSSFEPLIDAFSELFDEFSFGKESTLSFRDILRTIINVAITPLQLAIRTSIIPFRILLNIIRWVIEAITAGIQYFRQFANAVLELNVVQTLIQKFQDFAGAISSVVSRVIDMLDIFGSSSEAVDNMAESTDNADAKVSELNNDLEAGTLAFEENTEAIVSNSKAVEDAIAPLEALRKKQSELAGSVEQLVFSGEIDQAREYASELAKVTIELERVKQSTEDLIAQEKAKASNSAILVKSNSAIIESNNDLITSSAQLLENYQTNNLQMVEKSAVESAESVIESLVKQANAVSDLETLIQEFSENGVNFIDFFASNSEAVFETMFSSIIGQGDNFAKELASVMFDMLQQLVPVLVAQITGISLAQPDSVATFGASAVARVAILTGLLQAALSAARSAVGADGGVFEINESYSTPKSTRDTIPVWLRFGETVTTPEAARIGKNRDLLKGIHEHRDVKSEIISEFIQSQEFDNIAFTRSNLKQSQARAAHRTYQAQAASIVEEREAEYIKGMKELVNSNNRLIESNKALEKRLKAYYSKQEKKVEIHISGDSAESNNDEYNVILG